MSGAPATRTSASSARVICAYVASAANTGVALEPPLVFVVDTQGSREAGRDIAHPNRWALCLQRQSQGGTTIGEERTQERVHWAAGGAHDGAVHAIGQAATVPDPN